MSGALLVLSVALNGYDLLYRRCIRGQRAYAVGHGYPYLLVDTPRWETTRTESAWVKIPLISEALRRGYEWVFFVDADCEIRPGAPRIEREAAPGKSLYLGRGWSGRVNSGVILVRNAPESVAFFQRLLAAAEDPLPEADWAENGHMIHFTRDLEFLHILDRRWNNNADPALDDYIRHYSIGPMKPSLDGTPSRWLALRLARAQMRLDRRLARLRGARYRLPDAPLRARVDDLLRACLANHPIPPPLASEAVHA